MPLDGHRNRLLRLTHTAIYGSVRRQLLARLWTSSPAKGSLALPVFEAGVRPEFQHLPNHGTTAAVCSIEELSLVQQPIDMVDCTSLLNQQLHDVNIVCCRQPMQSRLAALVDLVRVHPVLIN